MVRGSQLPSQMQYSIQYSTNQSIRQKISRDGTRENGTFFIIKLSMKKVKTNKKNKKTIMTNLPEAKTPFPS